MFKTCRNLLKRHAITLQKRKQQTGSTSIFINGRPVQVPSYYSILQACRSQGIAMPSFCYHERLSVAGNCRMCLVTVEGMWKPQIACAVQVSKNMKIRTNNAITLKAQESVLEFILADHPLDCPICDQGGECDLQDLSMKFGNDRTRYTEIHFTGKRAVESKDLGPLINTEMNRCIHCTRCIRFASQVCGMDVLGSTGRGHHMLVGTYVDKMFLSELSGNIIDLCPVGALTSIPYRFKARPWELKTTNSIDVTDATGTNIVLNSRYNRVIRALPREHEEINQEWLSDKGRWAIDSTEMQRLVSPMVKCGSCLKPIEWDVALSEVAKIICRSDPKKLVAVAGPHCNVETLVAAKDLINMLDCDNTFIERSMCCTGSDTDIRAAYGLNINMKDVVTADKILLVGTNPRFEAPILNAWIRQAYRTNECDIYVVGPRCDYNYHVTYIANDITLDRYTDCLKGAKKPLIFVGVSQLGLPLSYQLMFGVYQYAKKYMTNKDWPVVHVITREASFAGALEAGWKPNALQALCTINPNTVISLGADEVFYNWNPPGACSIIYVGFQGDRCAQRASVVLPGCAYTEMGGTYLNMECRSQYAYPAVSPPGKARVDWKIFRAIAEVCGFCMSYSDIQGLHVRMGQVSPLFNCLGNFQPKLFVDCVMSLCKKVAQLKGSEQLDVCMKTLPDYYCSEIFSSNSCTMIEAKKAATKFQSLPYNKI
ncbi:NADH-ubiquinone oxidoreductase 75 kDa subunit, mitochondrial-like [Leguminivora glycinivorella]|uniref:NADH-ubiquinone oxidoreductase 75 kDa subunit, mitochondrial-like n=1 Tax=Leguminivora glycinivorella TaxID=1035111 RepID=UPI00200C34B1|nr:NADH-ubiquinone oxidoreductase 75 kDa subunit, mitochondrial-like [Leguminivora glycinivorella]